MLIDALDLGNLVSQVTKLRVRLVEYAVDAALCWLHTELYSKFKREGQDPMLRVFVKSIFGSRNERLVKQMGRVVKQINALEETYQALSDDEVKAKTALFRERVANAESLDSLLPEVFATVREASKRTLGLRHFDVQLIGGMVLHQGNIAEMRTGEGKTLASTLPAYLNALTGKGVHIVTVNDYLAERDADWMRPVFEFLGLTVGVNLTSMSPEDKQKAYLCDITYGTNNEFGFDYLRDNMAFSLDDKVQRDHHFAIVDEVDSILIDEARTPLIISGPSDENAEIYKQINALIPSLKKREEEDGPGDYYLDEKQKQAFLTEDGHERIETMFVDAGIITAEESLYDAKNVTKMSHFNACLRAHTLYTRDVEYIVRNDEVIIIDEHTGRSMAGRRWSDGLHQAVEAKEGVKIQNENQTVASITFQNYFRIYEKLSGMTGTADTEAFEFHQIYHLEVVVIPTNQPVARKDMPDQIYLNQLGKFKAIIEEVEDCQKRKQPVLVGTASIEASELLDKMLTDKKIEHLVLNAKFHAKEAHVIQQAGRPGTVTIATNMAGRGTDIVLGGNLEAELAALENPTEKEIKKVKADWQKRHDAVIEAGGLHITGSERHESRRIDNQLRGRSGRQGDPGSSRFYLSLDDTLMRIFASPRVTSIMKRLGMKEDDAIEHGIITRSIESAQRKVETYNFDVRKNLLEYDDVANEQRKVVYEQRDELLGAKHIADTIEAIREDVANEIVAQFIPPESLEEQWDVPGLENQLKESFGLELAIQKRLDDDKGFHEAEIREWVLSEMLKSHEEKIEKAGAEVVRDFEKTVLLQTLDQFWKEHLANMDHLRQGIHLRGYAQKDPKQEYKREAFTLFTDMLDAIKFHVLEIVSKVQIAEEDVEALEAQRKQQSLMDQQRVQTMHVNVGDIAGVSTGSSVAAADDETQKSEGSTVIQFKREGTKLGRNDPCHCGSGKKFKQCHGKL
jgi:preprotein translocase subunit SecA